MKKILLSLTLLLVAAAVFAQHPVGNDSLALQTLGNSNTLVKSKGAIGADSGLVIAKYADTTSANRGKIKNYPGAQIRTGNTVWLRDSTATRWINLVSEGGGGSGSGIGSVAAINGLSNVNDSTVKWGGFLVENTHIRGDNFTATIDSLKSFIVQAYGTNRSILYLDTGQAYLQGRGSTGSNGAIQLLPYFTPARGGSQQGVARIIGSSGTNASIIEVSEPTISFYKSGVNIPAKIFNKYVSDSLNVASPTKIAVWDNDTLKSASMSAVGGIDSIFITNTDSIFIITGNDTIYIGNANNAVDTVYSRNDSLFGVKDNTEFLGQYLTLAQLDQLWGIYINNPDSSYDPYGNYTSVGIGLDSNVIRPFIIEIINNDTSITNIIEDVDYVVDTVANAPPPGVANGYKALVGTAATGLYAGHENEIAELIGGVWTFTVPAENETLEVHNSTQLLFYKFLAGVWVLQSVPDLIGGMTGLFAPDIGTRDSNSFTIKTDNIPAIVVEADQNIYTPKYSGLEDSSIYFRPGIDGKLDTGYFRQLVGGTGIIITPGPNRTDTISSSGGGSGGTTSNQSITATAAQTAFTFTSVPASEDDYWIDVNGLVWNKDEYSAVSNTITLSTGLDADDIVTFHRTK